MSLAGIGTNLVSSRLEEKGAAGREASFEFLRKTSNDTVAHRAFLMRTSLLESVRKQAPITV